MFSPRHSRSSRCHWPMCGLLVLLSASPMAMDGPLYDPTRPSGYLDKQDATQSEQTTDPADGVRLGGIFTGPGGPTALLNGRRVRAGEAIGDLKVHEVEVDSVVVERGGKTWEIRVGLQPVKRLAEEAVTQ